MADVEGMDDLLKSLDRCGLSLFGQKQLVAKSLRAGAKKIHEPWLQRIPVRSGRSKKAAKVSVTNQTAESAEARIGVTGAGFALKFSEFGTVHQAARPTLGPAFEVHKDEAVSEIGSVLGSGIEDAWNG